MHSKGKCFSKLFLGFHLWDPTFNNCSPPLHTSPGSPRAASPHIRVTSHHTSRLSRVSTCHLSSHQSNFTSHFTPLPGLHVSPLLTSQSLHITLHASPGIHVSPLLTSQSLHITPLATSHISSRHISPLVTAVPSSRLSLHHVSPTVTPDLPPQAPARPTSRPPTRPSGRRRSCCEIRDTRPAARRRATSTASASSSMKWLDVRGRGATRPSR